MNGEQITFGKHIVDWEYFTEIIDGFDSMFQTECALLSNAFGCIDPNRNTVTVIECCACEGLDIIELADGIGEELSLEKAV